MSKKSGKWEVGDCFVFRNSTNQHVIGVIISVGDYYYDEGSKYNYKCLTTNTISHFAETSNIDFTADLVDIQIAKLLYGQI